MSDKLSDKIPKYREIITEKGKAHTMDKNYKKERPQSLYMFEFFYPEKKTITSMRGLEETTD